MTTTLLREETGMAKKGFFARRLKELREQVGLSQAGLEEASGVPAPTIRGFEQGRREPTYATLVKLAQGLGVPLSAFAPPETPKRPRKRK